MKLLGVREIWKVLREVDLEALRQSAGQRFEIVVSAEDVGDARRLAVLLTGLEPPHPWVPALSPSEAEARVRTSQRTVEPLDATILVSRAPELSPALAALRDAAGSGDRPVLVVVLGDGGPSAAVARRGETARVTMTEFEPSMLPVPAAALLAALPAERHLRLARQLPPVRALVLEALIEGTAKANAVYAFSSGLAEAIPILDVPLNVADMLVLTKNQLVMSYKIALAAGKDGRPRDLLGEVVGVLGGGFLFRQAARQLVGLVPILGIAPKVAVAYAGTWAIGRAVAAWATQGQALSAKAVRGFYREALTKGRRVAKALAAQAPSLPRRPAWLKRKRRTT